MHHLTPASERIASVIARDGPITFRRFMELALYDPEVGYYTRAFTGHVPSGDYVTSPELHPAFGALLCVQLDEMWRLLGEPDIFWLVEGGPGSGAFAANVLASAEASFPRFRDALQVALVERSPALRARQQKRLARWRDDVCFVGGWELGVGGQGCVFANELLDAFPVHRVVMTARGLREMYVTVESDRFAEVAGPLSTPRLDVQVRDGCGRLVVGQKAEVNLGAPAWIASAASLLDRGYVFLIDYGDSADQLYGPAHPRGTLRCYDRHTMNEDPFRRVGLQDITAHVDFSAVTRAAIGHGMSLLGATRQEVLLGRLGLPYLVERLEGDVRSRAERRAHERALRTLADPNGLGRHMAVAFGKNVSPERLAGFSRRDAVAPPDFPHLWEGASVPGYRSAAPDPSTPADRPP